MIIHRHIRVSIFAVLLACIPLAALGQSVMESVQLVYQRNKSLDERAGMKSPSCETRYYGLFTDGQQEKQTFQGANGEPDIHYRSWKEAYTSKFKSSAPVSLGDDGPRIDKSKIQQAEKKLEALFFQAKNWYGAEVNDTNFFSESPALLAEFRRRLPLVQFKVDDPEAEVRFPSRKEKEEQLKSLSKEEQLKSLSKEKRDKLIDEWEAEEAPVIEQLREEHSGAFFDEGYPIDASANIEVVGKNSRGRDITNEPRIRPELTWGAYRLAGVCSLAPSAFIMGHELTHMLDWTPSKLRNCLKGPKSVGVRATIDRSTTELQRQAESIFEFGITPKPDKEYGPYRFKKSRNLLLESKLETKDPARLQQVEKDVEAFITAQKLCLPSHAAGEPRKTGKQPSTHAGFNTGLGTHLIPMIDKCLRHGGIQPAAEMVRLLDRYNQLPDQMGEAAADFMGTKIAVRAIKNNFKTPQERETAALALLYSFPPMLYTEEAAVLINQVGSKKTNEERMLRIVLANTEFQELMGCSFRPERTPVECSVR